MASLSLCMIVKNEEEVLGRCLDSICNFVDEIIIVDTGSSDSTKDIAKKYTDKIFDFPWQNNFAIARNYSLSKSTSEFNLVLDADEILDLESGVELKKFISSKQKFIGRVKIKSQFYNHFGEITNSYAWVSRIFPKGVLYEGSIHEQVVSNLKSKNVNILVSHDGYIMDNKVTRNLPLLLLELEKNKEDAYLLFQVGKQYKISKQYLKSFSYYYKSYSVIDEKASFRKRLVVDFLYLLKELKKFDIALEVINKEKDILDDYTDFHFILGLLYLEMSVSNLNEYLSYVPLIEKAYLKCLELGDSTESDGLEGVGTYLASYNLGLYYELFGFTDKAKTYFEQSQVYGYKKAEERLLVLMKTK